MDNISIIVAMGDRNVIGKGSTIPWLGKLQADMHHFRKTTVGKVVVMGRKTWDSLPENNKPLPDRKNVVLTRDHSFRTGGKTDISYNPQICMRLFQNEEVYIIGGGEIYRIFLPYAKRLIVTHIDRNFDGDVFFPEIEKEWNFKVILEQPVDARNAFPFTIVEYTR